EPAVVHGELQQRAGAVDLGVPEHAATGVVPEQLRVLQHLGVLGPQASQRAGEAAVGDVRAGDELRVVLDGGQRNTDAACGAERLADLDRVRVRGQPARALRTVDGRHEALARLVA